MGVREAPQGAAKRLANQPTNFSEQNAGCTEGYGMKRLISVTLALVMALIAVAPEFAQAGSTYDWRSGNSYHWNRNGDGSTHVRGFNPHTGSQWTTTIQQNGDMRGTDSRGNLWHYNSRSGNYWNTNGRFCTGHGYARVCN
jgi:hypothetical protein